jgi:glucosamine kinase
MGGVAGPIEPWLAPRARQALGQPLGDALDGAILMARQSASKAAAAE